MTILIILNGFYRVYVGNCLFKTLLMFFSIKQFNQEDYDCQKIKSNSFNEVSEYHFILEDEKEVTITELLVNYYVTTP